MPDLKWTKTYDLLVENRHFQVFLSEHRECGFHASCQWYEKGRILKAPGQPTSLSFKLEQRHADTEADALDGITKWISEKFGDDCQLKEREI